MISKSQLLSYRQCPRKLWLERHRPEAVVQDGASEQRRQDGNAIGELARLLFDQEEAGVLIERDQGGLADRLERTRRLLGGSNPIFEAAFSADGGLFYADVVSWDDNGERRIIEVKSSSEVKDYHLDDAAIQWHVAAASGHGVGSIAIAHVDSEWVYAGDGDYGGLLRQEDVTAIAREKAKSVPTWLRDADAVLASPDMPFARRSDHCNKPQACGFSGHCRSFEKQPSIPADVLPDKRAKLLKAAVMGDEGVRELADIPDTYLNDRQLRVKQATLANEIHFDAEGAAADLAGLGFPAYFLDFETIAPTIPMWAGTRPFEKIPFQYSLHILQDDGALESRAFLDLTGGDPSRAMAEQLVGDCGHSGPVFAYNAGFEKGVIRRLALRYDDLSDALLGINERVVDLLTIARERYYHPSQKGSWSIKAVLPTIAPDLDYADLDGVRNGGLAMEAYFEATAADVTRKRREELRQQLVEYCKLDTFAMVRIWEVFRTSGIQSSSG